MSTITHSEPAPTLEEVWRLFKETDRKMQETDRQIKETAQQMKETDIKLNKLEKLFTSQWGKLVESLVEGALLDIFNQRGIPVQHTSTRNKGNYQGRSWEVDIVAKNGDAVIVVEVKTTLRPDDVKEFLDKLPHIKTWMREYAGNTVYGAMAYLSAEAGAEKMAQNKGLFVIKATGDSAYLENPTDFVARTY
jgi:hypothetical protein